ncbi:MAG: c-type cytochrome [Pseudomonadota bacterium]
MRKTNPIPIILLVALISAPAAVIAGDPNRGAILSTSCEGCHGEGGHSPGSMPDISGKTAEYLQITLEDFRSGARASTVMQRHVKGYTPEEIEQIAKFLEKKD